MALPEVDPAAFEEAYGRPSTGQEALDKASTALRLLSTHLLADLSKKLGKGLLEAQEAVAGLADVICSAYAVDSLRLRVERMRMMDHPDLDVAMLAAQVAARDYLDEAVAGAKAALDAIEEAGPTPTPSLKGWEMMNYNWRDECLSDFVAFIEALERPWTNTVRMRRELADVVIERGGWMIR